MPFMMPISGVRSLLPGQAQIPGQQPFGGVGADPIQAGPRAQPIQPVMPAGPGAGIGPMDPGGFNPGGGGMQPPGGVGMGGIGPMSPGGALPGQNPGGVGLGPMNPGGGGGFGMPPQYGQPQIPNGQIGGYQDLLARMMQNYR